MRTVLRKTRFFVPVSLCTSHVNTVHMSLLERANAEQMLSKCSASLQAGPEIGGAPQVLYTSRFSYLWWGATSLCHMNCRTTKWHQGRLILQLFMRAGQHCLTSHSSLLSIYLGNNWKEGPAWSSSSILICLFIITCLYFPLWGGENPYILKWWINMSF